MRKNVKRMCNNRKRWNVSLMYNGYVDADIIYRSLLYFDLKKLYMADENVKMFFFISNILFTSIFNTINILYRNYCVRNIRNSFEGIFINFSVGINNPFK